LKGCRIGIYVPGGSLGLEVSAEPEVDVAVDDNGFGERKCWGCKLCSLCRGTVNYLLIF